MKFFELPFSTRVAFRYLINGRSDRFFSWTAILSILGVAIGVATMIVVLSVINGFESELRNRFLNANSHIMMFRYPDGISDIASLQEKVNRDFGRDLTGTSPFVHYETMVRKGGIMHSVLARGFDPALREKVQSLEGWVAPREAILALTRENSQNLPDIPSVIVGRGLLSSLNAKIGDRVQIISPAASEFKRMQTFEIAGVYTSGLKHYDNRLVAMSLAAAQRFFDLGTRVTGLEVGLKNPNASDQIAMEMKKKFPSLSIKEWQSFNRPLLEVLAMERTVIFLVVCIVAVVAGFNILTTLFVAVTQKQREISLFKAIGAQNRQVLLIFLQQGAFFGLIGAGLGQLLALLISWLITTYKFIELPDPYYISNLPVDYDWRVYLTLGGFGLLICVCAGVFPALAAVRVAPTEGLKGSAKASV